MCAAVLSNPVAYRHVATLPPTAACRSLLQALLAEQSKTELMLTLTLTLSLALTLTLTLTLAPGATR